MCSTRPPKCDCMSACHAVTLQEVARLEAETQELYAENQQLNKQQAALGNEVRGLVPGSTTVFGVVQNVHSLCALTACTKRPSLHGVAQVRGLKQQANTLTDEASQLRYRLSQAQSQQELLRSQIVQVWGEAGVLSQWKCWPPPQAARREERACAVQRAAVPVGLLQLKACEQLSTTVPACSAAVQSPQKIQAMLEEISSAVERERGLVADADRRLRDLHARLDVISKVWDQGE